MHSDLRDKLALAQELGNSFCVWRLPGDEELQQAGPAPEMEWDGVTRDSEVFLFAPFHLEKAATFMIGEGGMLAKKNAEPRIPKSTSKDAYIHLVEKAVMAIRSGDFQKIVAARSMQIQNPEFDPVEHFLTVCATYPQAFCYMWFSPSTGLWLGASPELLFQKRGNAFRTVALAGTQANGLTPFGPKEIEEQDFVLRYLVEQLSPYVENLEVGKKNQINSGHLLHLVNELTGVLKTENSNLKELVYSLHPTPAVGGLPKEKATLFIDKEEGFDRTYYSGFLGTHSLQQTNLFVNLRCMQVFGPIQCVYVGAGLTQDSIAEKEWLETEEKSKVILLR